MYDQAGAVLVFVILGVLFVFGGLFVGSLIRTTRRHREKLTIYECGEPTIGSSWIRYNSRFYNVALVYLLFDVEIVILIPAMLRIRALAAQGAAIGPMIALAVFLGLLILGLAYEWYYGNLDWIHRADATPDGDSDDRPAPRPDEENPAA